MRSRIPLVKMSVSNKKAPAERVFLIVLDSAGIGNAPDAAQYGDEGANTFLSISRSEKFNIPNLKKAGLGCIEGVEYLGGELGGAVCRLSERSRGKDTTTGHWEMMGVISDVPFPTYPDGFPDGIIEKFSAATGRGVLCNKPYSGTAVINDYGAEHLRTGALIVYTSADSVFQIAAHEDIVPPEKLYEYCRIARDILVGEHAVGRVIARPFEGEAGAFKRTARRHDFSLEPTGRTLLDAIKDAGLDSIAVGKISDIFAARGITESIPTVSNADGMARTEELLERDFHGLCFVNLVEFDMTYGHRNDVEGYAAAMSEFDRHLGRLLPRLREGDVLMITADHGCDPAFTQSTDHSRECVPWLILGKGVRKINLGTKHGFNHIAGAVATLLGVDFDADCADVTEDILES